jgi:FkbM family methyltransferase
MRRLIKAVGVFIVFSNWITYFMDYLKRLPGRYDLFRVRDGTLLFFRPATLDRFAITETWVYGIYNPTGYEINYGDTVVDIGAHIGSFAVYAGRMAKRVVAYEPVPENYKVMEMNLELNGMSNVTSIHGCVGGKRTSKRIYISEGNTCGHSEFHLCGGTRYIDVKSTSLDNVFIDNNLGRIDFLKIDCEGGEYEILNNTSMHALNRIDKIAMEYHEFDGHRAEELIKILKTAGFDVTIKPGNSIGMIYARRKPIDESKGWDISHPGDADES